MSRFVSFTILLLVLSLMPRTVSAGGINLHPSACEAALRGTATDREVIAAEYRCGTDGPIANAEWLWLRLDASSVRSLPSGWQLRIDQTRFDEIALR